MTPQTQAPFLRVTAIEVKDLFGLYHHKVVLNAKDRITIIHGPNGVGKTVFLSLTTALLTDRMARFLDVPFSTFSVSFDDGSVLTLEKIEKALSNPNQSVSEPDEVKLIYHRNDGTPEEQTLSYFPDSLEDLAKQIAEEIPFLYPMGNDRWADERTGAFFDNEAVIAQYGPVSPRQLKKSKRKVPAWLKELRHRINVHFIETQRLIKLSGNLRTHRMPGNRNTVSEYADDLKKRISEILAEYGRHAEKLDQTFPQRLLRTTTINLDIEQLKKRMTEIREKRQKLSDIGLLSESAEGPTAAPDDNIDETQRRVMTLYVEDTLEKLSVFDDLANRIEILCTIVNGKFQNKELRIVREIGLQAVDSNNHPLPLDALSSGEQHEIVLLYDLLFKVRPNTLILLDEPELSLHVTWQKNFLEDLSKIVTLSEFDVLLATHSPYIVGDRTDLMIPLSTEVSP